MCRNYEDIALCVDAKKKVAVPSPDFTYPEIYGVLLVQTETQTDRQTEPVSILSTDLSGRVKRKKTKNSARGQLPLARFGASSVRCSQVTDSIPAVTLYWLSISWSRKRGI